MKPDQNINNPEPDRRKEPTELQPAQHQLLLEASSIIEDLHRSNTRASEFIRKISGLEGESGKMGNKGASWADILSNYSKPTDDEMW